MEEVKHTHGHLNNNLNEHQPDPKQDFRQDTAYHHDQVLAYCSLFKGLTQGEHDDFLNRNVRKIFTFKKEETVVRQGDPIHLVMLPVQGSVKTEMITQEGNVLNIDIMEAVLFHYHFVTCFTQFFVLLRCNHFILK